MTGVPPPSTDGPPATPQSRTATQRLAWQALFCAAWYPVGGVALGFLPLAESRLEVALGQLGLAIGLCVGTGIAAALWATRWLRGRGGTLRARLNLLGWGYGVQAAAALLGLGISSAADPPTLAAVIGLTVGCTLPVAIATAYAATTPAHRAMEFGQAIFAAPVAAGVLHLSGVRPEGFLALTAAFMSLTGWQAWSRQVEATPAGD